MQLTKRESNINYFACLPQAKKEEYLNHVFITYEKNKQPVLVAFAQSGYKPFEHYSFRSPDNLNTHIEQLKKSIDRAHEQHLNRLKEWDKEKELLVVDAILCSSWGYEQTNIDFYIILDRKGDTVTIQEIGKSKTYSTIGARTFDDRGECTPDKTTLIGEPFRKRISKYASINLESYKHCALWDGRPKSWSSYA